MCTYIWGFPSGSMVKDPPTNAGDLCSIPWSGRSPGGGHGNPLSILAWRIPGTEEPGRLQSIGSLQSCLTLCDPMNCRLPGSSVPGILQARILSGLPCPPSEDLPHPGIEYMSLKSPAGSFFTTSAAGKPPVSPVNPLICSSDQ